MRYSAPLLDFDDKDKPTISNDHWSLLTAAQRAKFAFWSMETGLPVWDVLKVFKPLLTDLDGRDVELAGNLPTCPSMACCLMPDGSVHT